MEDFSQDDELAAVWVPPGGAAAQRDLPVVRLLDALNEAAVLAGRGESAAARLHRGVASQLLGESALATLDHMQLTGELPVAGTDGWAELVRKARAGGVDVAFALIVHDEPAPPPVRAVTQGYRY